MTDKPIIETIQTLQKMSAELVAQAQALDRVVTDLRSRCPHESFKFDRQVNAYNVDLWDIVETCTECGLENVTKSVPPVCPHCAGQLQRVKLKGPFGGTGLEAVARFDEENGAPQAPENATEAWVCFGGLGSCERITCLRTMGD